MQRKRESEERRGGDSVRGNQSDCDSSGQTAEPVGLQKIAFLFNKTARFKGNVFTVSQICL